MMGIGEDGVLLKVGGRSAASLPPAHAREADHKAATSEVKDASGQRVDEGSSNDEQDTPILTLGGYREGVHDNAQTHSHNNNNNNNDDDDDAPLLKLGGGSAVGGKKATTRSALVTLTRNTTVSDGGGVVLSTSANKHENERHRVAAADSIVANAEDTTAQLDNADILRLQEALKRERRSAREAQEELQVEREHRVRDQAEARHVHQQLTAEVQRERQRALDVQLESETALARALQQKEREVKAEVKTRLVEAELEYQNRVRAMQKTYEQKHQEAKKSFENDMQVYIDKQVKEKLDVGLLEERAINSALKKELMQLNAHLQASVKATRESVTMTGTALEQRDRLEYEKAKLLRELRIGREAWRALIGARSIIKYLAISRHVQESRIRKRLRSIHSGVTGAIEHMIEAAGLDLKKQPEADTWIQQSLAVIEERNQQERDARSAQLFDGSGKRFVSRTHSRRVEMENYLSLLSDVVLLLRVLTDEVLREKSYWRDTATAFFERNTELTTANLATEHELEKTRERVAHFQETHNEIMEELRATRGLMEMSRMGASFSDATSSAGDTGTVGGDGSGTYESPNLAARRRFLENNMKLAQKSVTALLKVENSFMNDRDAKPSMTNANTSDVSMRLSAAAAGHRHRRTFRSPSQRHRANRDSHAAGGLKTTAPLNAPRRSAAVTVHTKMLLHEGSGDYLGTEASRVNGKRRASRLASARFTNGVRGSMGQFVHFTESSVKGGHFVSSTLAAEFDHSVTNDESQVQDGGDESNVAGRTFEPVVSPQSQSRPRKLVSVLSPSSKMKPGANKSPASGGSKLSARKKRAAVEEAAARRRAAIRELYGVGDDDAG